jgi:hypothetical protein
MLKDPKLVGNPPKKPLKEKKKNKAKGASIANKATKPTPPPVRRLPLKKEPPKALIAGKLILPKSPIGGNGKSAKKETGKAVKPKVKSPSNKGGKSKNPPMDKGKRGPGLRGSSRAKAN